MKQRVPSLQKVLLDSDDSEGCVADSRGSVGISCYSKA